MTTLDRRIFLGIVGFTGLVAVGKLPVVSVTRCRWHVTHCRLGKQWGFCSSDYFWQLWQEHYSKRGWKLREFEIVR